MSSRAITSRKHVLVDILVLAAVGFAPGCSSDAEPASESQGESITSASPLAMYDDAAANGWSIGTWGGSYDLANTSPVKAGTRSIRATFAAWGGIGFGKSFATAGYDRFRFWANAGSSTNPKVVAYVKLSGAAASGAEVDVRPYCTGGTLPANAWVQCSVPLSALGASNATVGSFYIQEGNGVSRPSMYFDQVEVYSSSTTTTPPPTSTTTPTTDCWTKPSDFDSKLQASISTMRYDSTQGYLGQIPNPFPSLPGTVKFSNMQITRVDAIQLGSYFGRCAFRFYVDSGSMASNGLRSEFTGESDYAFKSGDTYNYKFNVYFDGNYKNSSWTDWNMFEQFHSPDFPAWGLHTAGGYILMGPPGAPSDSLRAPMPSRNTWHAFSWTVHWAADSSGSARLDVDGANVFDFKGATMHAGEPYYYPKFGSYLAHNYYTQVTYSTPWVVTKM